MRDGTRIINSLLHDDEFYKGGIPEATQELRDLGFTEYQIYNIQKKLRTVALDISDKVIDKG